MSAHGAAQPMTARRSGPLRAWPRCRATSRSATASLIFGALAVGETRITGLLEGQDVLDTAKAMRAFGAEVDAARRGRVDACMAWASAASPNPRDVIDCGNSGTGVRLIMGAMATTPITATFTGDASLRKRPDGAGDRPAGAVRRAGLRPRRAGGCR